MEAELVTLRNETRSEIKDVRGEIKELRSAMEKRFDRVDDHLTRLHSITGEGFTPSPVNTKAAYRH